MFNGVEHTAIASPDPEGLADWYCNTLEFRVVHISDGNVFLRDMGGALMEIIPSTGPRGPNQRTDPGIRHLAIGVDDFDAACDRLRQLNVTFLTEPSPAPGNRIVFFEESDGNILHLIHREHPMP